MVSGWTVTLACSTIAAPAETIQSSGTLYPDSEVGPDLLTIPVVIFSTSQAETDIAASYQLHANAYITKPVSLDLFTEAIRQVDDFFLTLVKLPAEDGKREQGSGPKPGCWLNGRGENAADALEGARSAAGRTRPREAVVVAGAGSSLVEDPTAAADRQ
jgi:hypothetical protein